MLRRSPIIAAALLAASPAPAGPRRVPPVELTYARGSGAEACPEVEALRRAVLKEMGYDPFVDGSPPGQAPRLRVSIERRAGQYEVEMEMRDEAGRILWSVEGMRSRSDCRTLVEALGLSIVIRIDPVPAPAPPPVCSVAATPAGPPAPASTPSPSALPTAPPAPRPEAAPGGPGLPLVLLGGGPLMALESPLAVAVGVSLLADLRWRIASLALEARAVFPGAGGRQGHRIDASSFTVVIAPCARLGPLFGCGLVEAGAVVPSGPEAPSPVRALAVFGAGVRAGFEQRLSRRLALRAHADLLGTLTHERALLDSGFIWSAPEAAGVIGVALLIAPRGSFSPDTRVPSTSSTKEAAP